MIGLIDIISAHGFAYAIVRIGEIGVNFTASDNQLTKRRHRHEQLSKNRLFKLVVEGTGMISSELQGLVLFPA